MWGRLNRLNDGVAVRYDDLMGRLNSTEASDLLTTCAGSVSFFGGRVIQDMKTRDFANGFTASVAEGQRRMDQLADPTQASEVRAEALGRILYQVRNNLAHGSKGGFATDDLIIEKSVLPMKKLLEIAIQESRTRLPLP